MKSELIVTKSWNVPALLVCAAFASVCTFLRSPVHTVRCASVRTQQARAVPHAFLSPVLGFAGALAWDAWSWWGHCCPFAAPVQPPSSISGLRAAGATTAGSSLVLPSPPPLPFWEAVAPTWDQLAHQSAAHDAHMPPGGCTDSVWKQAARFPSVGTFSFCLHSQSLILGGLGDTRWYDC